MRIFKFQTDILHGIKSVSQPAVSPMSAKSSQELLEPQLSPDRAREKLVRSLLVKKPEIFRVPAGGPGVLQSVKSFLPQMAEADKQLNEAVARDGADKFNVENVGDDENVIEMDIAVMGQEKEREDWTSDSDADSTPSPSENSYTSDTDISSSSTCSSSSCDEAPTQNK